MTSTTETRSGAPLERTGVVTQLSGETLATKVADYLARWIARTHPDDAANQMPNRTIITIYELPGSRNLYEVELQVSPNAGYSNRLTVLVGRGEFSFAITFLPQGETVKRATMCGTGYANQDGSIHVAFATTLD
jgi:hypothetical protein